MTKRSSPQDRAEYLGLRSAGLTRAEAARAVGYSAQWGVGVERVARGGKPLNNGHKADRVSRDQAQVGHARPRSELSQVAKDCLDDFGRFRARYLGRISTPWQEDAAHKVALLLASPEKEFLVINCPPGSGKTTLVQHDIPLWLTCRNRAIRGLMGHRVQSIANTYAGRLKRTLERTVPMQAKDDEKVKGLALDAVSSVSVDYGRFKPEDSSIWTRNSFTVAQLVETPTDEKESTWTAFGMDSGFLGYRVDFANWDDLVANKTMRNEQSIEDQRTWWDTEGESRLEPGGLLCLVGQRLSSVDLYRYCLDKEAGVEELDFEEDGLDDHFTGVMGEDRRKKYHHIVYKAHDDSVCRGLSPAERKEMHRPTGPYWRPDGTGGCLLDPRRVTWRDVRVAQVNPLSKFETVYQQQDVDPRNVLVNPVWVAGGKGLDGSVYPGCWDSRRGEWEFPATAGQQFDTVTVDPSPTKWWSCIAEGSLVETKERGEVPIERVTPGDSVLTRWGWRRVARHSYMGRKPTLRVGLDNGRTLTLTADHRVLASGGRWVEARELRSGSTLCGAARVGGSATSPANPLARLGDDEVVPGVLVPPGAVSGSHLGDDVSVPAIVVTEAFGDDVVGVDALPVVAEVGGGHPLWEGFATVVEDSPGQPVGEPLPVPSEAFPYGAVAVVEPTVPLPAPGGGDSGAGQEEPSVDDEAPLGGGGAVPRADCAVATLGVTHVVSVTEGSTLRTYDLEVEGHHEFAVEGVIVHNCQFWSYVQDESMPHLGGLRYLIAHLRQVMDAPTFLDFNVSTRSYSGVAEEWWQLSNDKGHPYTRLIVEENAAQRFMLQYDHVKRWASLRNVAIIPHATHRNKSNPEFGVQTVAPHWMYGRVRLPGRRDDPGRLGAMKLVEEVTRWPDGATDDCVPAGTMVTTRSGPRPIEAIVGGEQVLTHKGRWREVERVGKRPEADALYTVKAAGALPLRLTGNHRLLVCKGWRESYSKREVYDPTDVEWVAAEDLVAGQRHSREPIALVTPFDTTVEVPEGVTEGFALLVGLYLAEGSCSDHAVHIACHADHLPIHEFVERAMAERFGAKTKGFRRGGSDLALCTQSVAAKAYFARFGKSSEKRLPDEMMRWPAHLQRAIVRGWLIGDGTAAGETQVGGTSISRPLLWQMEALTARIGLRSALRVHQEPRKYEINGRSGQSRRSWTLTIPSAVIDKSDPLDAWRWPGLRDPSHFNSGVQVHDGMMLRKLRTVTREPWKGTVYNLQVEQDESYVAEGVAVHNCVMAHWFHEYHLPNFVAEQLQMPSIYKDLRRFNRWRKGAA